MDSSVGITGAVSSGVYTVDLNHDDSVTGITGAELSVHSFGHQDPVCSALRPNTPCTQVAVGGQRYIVWAASPVDQCCRCCSWAEGCGPTLMVQNATYEGQRAVDGQVCNSYRSKLDHMLQRANDSQPCGINRMVFDPLSYETPLTDQGVFAVPRELCGPCNNASFTCGRG